MNYLITGASQGFGEALSRRLCENGNRVWGVVRDESRTPKWAAEYPGLFTAIVGDVRDEALSGTIRDAVSGSTIDVVINNAGIPGNAASISDTSTAEIHELLDVHCLGTMRVIQGALAALEKSPRPTIVNISSRLGSISRVSKGEFDELPVSYSMRIAKGALNMLTACLQRELVPRGYCVFAVHPGQIKTRMGNPDANLRPEKAADRFLAWLDNLGPDDADGYVEPGVGEIAW